MLSVRVALRNGDLLGGNLHVGEIHAEERNERLETQRGEGIPQFLVISGVMNHDLSYERRAYRIPTQGPKVSVTGNRAPWS